MWVRTPDAELINLGLCRAVEVQAGAIVAWAGEERRVLYRGDPEACRAALAHLTEGLASRQPLLDLRVVEP